MEAKAIVIVGGGIAGLSAAEAARKADPEAEITILSEEGDQTYYRLRVAEVLADPAMAEKLYVHPAAWYDEQKVHWELRSEMTALDPEAHTLTLKDGRTVHWDKLIYTCGSTSFLLPIEGFGGEACFTLWSLESARHFAAEIREKGLKTCAIIGGGLLGLEAAWQLHLGGVKVKILERAPHLLQRQLDDRASALLEKYIETFGMEVVLNADSKRIEHSEDGSRCTRIVLADDREVACDAVLLSVGVRANTAVAEEAGLKIGRRICVNDKMETVLPDIYAAGDVCEVDNGYWFGLWSISKAEGAVAGANAAGGDKHFEKVVPPYIVNTMKTRIVSQGQIPEEEGDGFRFEVEVDEAAYSYKKLVYKDDKLVGFILLGDAAKAMVELQKQLA